MPQIHEILKNQIRSDLRQRDLPDSLLIWTDPEESWTKPDYYSWDDFARQILDMTTLPDADWQAFRGLSGRLSPTLDRELDQAQAFRDINSVQKVRQYFEAELLTDRDDYGLGGKNTGPGFGMGVLFNQLLRISRLPDLSSEQREFALQRLKYWETAVIDIITNPDSYYQKTSSGYEGTLSEFFGSMVSSCAHLRYTPNAADGEYFRRLKAAFCHDEIASGQFTDEDDPENYRQFVIGCLMYDLQTPDACESEEYWTKILHTSGFEAVVNARFYDDEDL